MFERLKRLVYEKKKTETAGIHGVRTTRCARSAAQFGGHYMVVHVRHVRCSRSLTVLFLLHPIPYIRADWSAN